MLGEEIPQDGLHNLTLRKVLGVGVITECAVCHLSQAHIRRLFRDRILRWCHATMVSCTCGKG